MFGAIFEYVAFVMTIIMIKHSAIFFFTTFYINHRLICQCYGKVI